VRTPVTVSEVAARAQFGRVTAQSKNDSGP